MSESKAIRRCANRCFFCFVDGLPDGLRRSLYVKDDDLLHSFLFGNFVTLTNLREADWERLQVRRLSPLFVSVHATDLALRRHMLGNAKAPDIMEQIKRLGDLRIQVHAQIVLCPGVNDGDRLSETIGDLASLYPIVQSVAVVPVGVTRHTIARKGDAALRYTPAEAIEIVDLVKPLQNRLRGKMGLDFVYLADEFYLMAGVPIPSAKHYDGFPQLGNGIGMTRKLLEQWRYLRRKLASSLTSVDRHVSLRPSLRRTAIVTGTLIASTFSNIVAELNQHGRTRFELVPVANEFFGPSVTVSGLLTATDVISALREKGEFEVIVLPRNMLDADGDRFLDGFTPADIKRQIGADVVAAQNLSELFAAASLA